MVCGSSPPYFLGGIMMMSSLRCHALFLTRHVPGYSHYLTKTTPTWDLGEGGAQCEGREHWFSLRGAHRFHHGATEGWAAVIRVPSVHACPSLARDRVLSSATCGAVSAGQGKTITVCIYTALIMYIMLAYYITIQNKI